METDENLIRFMDAVASGEAVPAGLADRLIADYPWFVLPAAMRLQRGSDRLDADARQILAARVALGMADRTAMLRLADDRGACSMGLILRLPATKLLPPKLP